MRKSALLYIVPILLFISTGCGLFNNDSTNVYTLSTTVTPAESGTITPTSGEYDEGTEVELQAEAAEGYEFVGWEGDTSGVSNPVSLTFNDHKEVVAVFKRKEYTLGITVEGEGTVNEEIIEQAAKTDYEHGTTVEITAEPAEGWIFVEWQGDVTGSENPSTIVVEEEKNVTAIFEQREFAVHTSVEGEGTIVADPHKEVYQYGDDITFTAIPDETWRFIEWQGDVSGTDTTVTIEGIDSEKNISAVFVPIESPLWAMGYNHNGQLGDGTQTEQHNPVRNIYEVAKVTAGAFHSLFVKTDGTLWAMGYNSNGQIGNGTDEDQHVPVQIDSDVDKIAAGEHHSLYIKNDGTLWAMGQNQDGQLGDGSVTDRLNPVQIDTDVIEVGAGAWHSMYVKSDGSLWVMGRNNYGQLGNSTNINSITPVQIDTDVVAVAGGKNHSLYAKEDGTLYGMGRNASGQLGIGNNETPNLPPVDQNSPVEIDSNVEKVAAGTDHSLYIKNDGSLWTMGNNEYGQLGDGTTDSNAYPLHIVPNAIEIAAGNRHSLFITADGTLYGMGFNGNGQLGDGTVTNRHEPILIDSGVHSVAAGINHSLYIHD